MSFYSVPQTYSSLLGSEDIPAVMLPSTQSKMIPCTSQLKAVRTSSANPSAGSLALWQLQTGAGAGYLKPGSVYLRGAITVEMAAGAIAGDWRFSGPPGVHSASAVINRLTVANGSQQISQLVNYHVYADLLKCHAVSNDYVNNDSILYEMTGITRGCGAQGAAGNAANLSFNFAIPLISPVFNSQQAIPLFLLNSPLSVEILFNSVGDALVGRTGAGANQPLVGYTITNAEICYEEIIVSPELKASVMQRLNSGAVWKMYLDSVYSLATTATAGLAYNIGVGLSSCKGVIALDREPVAGLNCGNFVYDGFSNARVFYDGKLINNYDLTTDATVYAELNRTMHALFDSNITSSFTKVAAPGAGANTWSDFVAFKFAYGVSSQSVNDYSVSFSGSPCQQILLQTFNDGAANNSNFPYAAALDPNNLKTKVIFVLYDELMTIDANGVVSLMR
jgi:hypothetical protein